jgi:hypothetical protein
VGHEEALDDLLTQMLAILGTERAELTPWRPI